MHGLSGVQVAADWHWLLFSPAVLHLWLAAALFVCCLMFRPPLTLLRLIAARSKQLRRTTQTSLRVCTNHTAIASARFVHTTKSTAPLYKMSATSTPAPAPTATAATASAGSKSKPVSYCANSQVVLLSYDDLVAGVDVSDSIAAAFGADGLGIVAVSGVPNFVERRAKLLPLAHK